MYSCSFIGIGVKRILVLNDKTLATDDSVHLLARFPYSKGVSIYIAATTSSMTMQ